MKPTLMFRSEFVHRDYSGKKWTPNPLEVIANTPTNNKELEEAKSRVIFKEGRYQYTPSSQYMLYRAKFLGKKFKHSMFHGAKIN